MVKKLTIIHFNDVYNIEPPKGSSTGGAARMAGYIKSCEDLNPLVLFSGDAFNPSLLSIFLKGEQMVSVLNAIGVQCAVFGNHDFDYAWVIECLSEEKSDFGIDHLEDMIEKTKFPWLLSNVVDNLTDMPLAEGKSYHIIDWCGLKIGLIGLVEEEWIVTLATLDPEDVTYIDYVTEGKRLARHLRQNEGVDFVFALTHMRWPNDRRLAESVEEIDIILGGHDHDYGLEKVNGKYIVKSGSDFFELSKITFTLDKQHVEIDVEKVNIDSSVTEDDDVKEIVQSHLGEIDKKMDEQLGVISVDLDGRFSAVRNQETNLGNFVTDIMLNVTNADITLLNSGTFRSNKIHSRGNFFLRDLLTILPLVDPLVVLKVNGRQLIEALENGVSQYPKLEGRFPQVAGVVFGFDPSKPPKQRIDPSNVHVNGVVVDMEKDYKLCTKEYISQGKDGYDVFRSCDILVSDEQCPTLSTAVRNHFEAVQMCTGLKPCKSGHRQSLIGLVRKESIIIHEVRSNHSLSRQLVRQNSIHNAETERCEISPKVEGRIYFLNNVEADFNSNQTSSCSSEDSDTGSVKGSFYL